MEIIEVKYPAEEMDDWQFIRYLQKTGQIKWEVFGSQGCFRVVGKPFTLNDDFPKGIWALFTWSFSIGVKCFHKGLAKEWPTLDWNALIAEGKKLDDKFRDSPDW